jgi:predicted CoA-binding protein
LKVKHPEEQEMANTPSKAEIRDVLTRYHRVAIVGLSPDPARPSHEIAQYLIEQGYDVVGVRPGATKILDRPCYPSVSEVPGPVEIVDVFRAPEHVPDIVDDAIRSHAQVLWLQEGVTHPEAEKRAREAGLVVISDRCILKEHAGI